VFFFYSGDVLLHRFQLVMLFLVALPTLMVICVLVMKSRTSTDFVSLVRHIGKLYRWWRMLHMLAMLQWESEEELDRHMVCTFHSF